MSDRLERLEQLALKVRREFPVTLALLDQLDQRGILATPERLGRKALLARLELRARLAQLAASDQ